MGHRVFRCRVAFGEGRQEEPGMTQSKSKCSREGSKLRQLRLKLRLTQERLAQRGGVTTHAIWRLENDPVFSPRLETLRAVAKALGVDASYFLNAAVGRS
jgi:DNA-binding XRE family transcriptional regulator